MLMGIDPVLTGTLLKALDELGHGDGVVVADAHFTGASIARRAGAVYVDLPELSTPRVLKAIRSVIPPDDLPAPGLDLMECPDGLLDVQRELMDAAGVTLAETRLVERFAFYDEAAKASLIIRTGETRIYGNALLRKGIVRRQS